MALLEPKDDRRFLEKAQAAMSNWRERMVPLESPDRDPIQPQYAMRAIDRLASDDAILSTDSGTIATWVARHYDIRGDREFLLSGNLATMAPGLPYAIAAQNAYPGRQCIAFVGDGGFAMLMAEFLTAARYELPIKVFICNNGLYGQILWEQMVLASRSSACGGSGGPTSCPGLSRAAAGGSGLTAPRTSRRPWPRPWRSRDRRWWTLR